MLAALRHVDPIVSLEQVHGGASTTSYNFSICMLEFLQSAQFKREIVLIFGDSWLLAASCKVKAVFPCKVLEEVVPICRKRGGFKLSHNCKFTRKFRDGHAVLTHVQQIWRQWLGSLWYLTVGDFHVKGVQVGCFADISKALDACFCTNHTYTVHQNEHLIHCCGFCSIPFYSILYIALYHTVLLYHCIMFIPPGGKPRVAVAWPLASTYQQIWTPLQWFMLVGKTI